MENTKDLASDSKVVLISCADLSAEALNGIVESFILREGTDYGFNEVDHETKMAQVLDKIKNQEFLMTYDFEEESVTLLTRQQWNQINKENG